jgi:hypothetical protein
MVEVLRCVFLWRGMSAFVSCSSSYKAQIPQEQITASGKGSLVSGGDPAKE